MLVSSLFACGNVTGFDLKGHIYHRNHCCMFMGAPVHLKACLLTKYHCTYFRPVQYIIVYCLLLNHAQ